jgi:putative SOS response-associated peptidase YedK
VSDWLGERGCGYVRRSRKQKVAEWFHVDADLANLPMPHADYNIAPTTSQPISRQSRETGAREMVLARWGLVPSFANVLSEAKGISTIDANGANKTAITRYRALRNGSSAVAASDLRRISIVAFGHVCNQEGVGEVNDPEWVILLCSRRRSIQ